VRADTERLVCLDREPRLAAVAVHRDGEGPPAGAITPPAIRVMTAEVGDSVASDAIPGWYSGCGKLGRISRNQAH